MPRIRKKTSNRQSTNDRRKIQHKARESRKKKIKQSKKNTQWKSKHKKDPGIPNDFPYKDQILGEVAEQRRLAIEEKEKRKEEKRLARQQTKGDTEDRDSNDGQQEGSLNLKKDLDVGIEAIASLSAKLITPKLITNTKVSAEVVDEEDDDIPALVNHDLPSLKAVLDASDVLLEILDSRDPLPFRSRYLEKVVEGKKVLLVMNKIDTCPREALSAWLKVLRREHPTYLFRSATAFLPTAPEATALVRGKGKVKASYLKDDALGASAILAQLSIWAKEKDGTPLNVAVVGLTNAGKSSFLNSLLHKASLPVYSLPTSSRGPTTTVLPQEVAVEIDGKSIRFVDTPGLTWCPAGNPESLESLRAQDILLRSKGRIDRLKDPSPAVAHIVSRANTEDLMLMYSLAAFVKGDPSAFLSGVARSNQLVKKRGELDLLGASKIVLRDWNVGGLMRYTMPPATHNSEEPGAPGLNETDEDILSQARTRKEIRRSGGLVRLVPSEMEEREVALDRPWEEEEADGGSGSEEEDEEMEDSGSDSDGDEDEGNDSEGEEQEQEEGSESEVSQRGSQAPAYPLSTRKRKRTSFVSAPPTKKVTFVPQKQGHKPPSSKDDQGRFEPRPILKKGVTTTTQKSSMLKKQKWGSKGSGRTANTVSSSKNMSNTTTDPNAYEFSKFF